MKKSDFESIAQWIDWFETLPVGHTDLDGLMHCRRVLSCINVRLAAYVGELARLSQMAEGSRKIEFAKKRGFYIESQKLSVAAATAKAEEDIVDFREAENKALGRYQSGKVLAESINQVLNALAGEMNFLGRERQMAGQDQD